MAAVQQLEMYLLPAMKWFVVVLQLNNEDVCDINHNNNDDDDDNAYDVVDVAHVDGVCFLLLVSKNFLFFVHLLTTCNIKQQQQQFCCNMLAKI